MEKEIKVSENGLVVLTFLQGQDEPLTGAAIAEATGLNAKGIHGVLNALVKNGLVAKGDKVTMAVVNKEGNKEEREYVTYFVTDLGAQYTAK